MSNQKKREQARLQEAEFEKMTSKRDIEIVSRLKQAQMEERVPFDRKAYTYFYSGAKWADENPSDQTRRRYFLVGFFAGMLLVLLLFAVYMILKIEGLLW